MGVGVVSFSLGDPSVTRITALVWHDQQMEHWSVFTQEAFIMPLAVWVKSNFGLYGEAGLVSS